MHLDETDVKTLKALTAKARLSSRQVDKQCDISIGTTPDQKREFIVQKQVEGAGDGAPTRNYR